MRFKSKKQKGYTVYAITGINSVSFAIDAGTANKKGLLGFAVERADPLEDERFFMFGYKVFENIIPHPVEDLLVSTFEHPVQSFVWDDFTLKPGHEYTYFFHPVKGKPKNLIREAPVEITIRTEPMFSSLVHDIFFNRGVASSQAYARRFDNLPPDKLEGKKKEEALQWLSRELDEAMLGFIRQAKKGDTLLGCFYEFRYLPVVEEFAKAVKRGVDVKIVMDTKANKESFPKKDNLAAVKTAKLPKKCIISREANTSYIQHNKFIIYLRGKTKKPISVFTGSTNVSYGGIFGQTNVGHWVRDENTVSNYKKYWELISGDPGNPPKAGKKKKRLSNADYKKEIMKLSGDIAPKDIKKIPEGVTAFFSPREKLTMLDTYAALLDSAKKSAFITLAFGIGKVFKDILRDNTKKSHIVFMLLEKEDRPAKGKETEFVKLGIENNIYQAYGSYLREPLYAWTKAEANPAKLGINKHVSYIHSKFMLADPMTADPIVVTGSANFSDASTRSNDENMLIIRGDLRVADIYFTEFNRLFNHYYFRAVFNKVKQQGKGKKKSSTTDSLFLLPDDSWLAKYKPGTFRAKRVQMFKEMKGLTKL